jgi:hypothetical protein
MLLLKNKSIPLIKLDRDMDKGWQMSRDWVDNPDVEQRCQIVGDKMLTAMHNDNKKLLMLLAAYMLSRIPGIKGIRIDTHGEMMESELVME